MADTTRDMKPGARLRILLRPAQQGLRLGAALSLLSALIWPVQAVVLAKTLAALLTHEPGPAPLIAALVFLGLAALRAGLSYLAEGALFRASDAVSAASRAAILARELRASAAGAFGGPGAVAALAAEKLDALHPYVTRYYPAMARSAVMPLLILALAFWHSWAVGVVLLVAGPLIPVFMALVGWAAKEASERQMVEIGSVGELLVDRLAAMGDIRLLDAGARVTADFATRADDLRRRTMRVLSIAFLSSTVLELFAALGVAMVAVWVGFSLLDLIHWGAYGGIIAPWAGIFLLLLAPEYFQPLRDLSAAWHDRASAEAVASDLARWAESPLPPILGTGAAPAPLPGPATIAFSGLSHHGIRYPDTAIAPGETIAVTGPSGAGKTTLLRLIAGLEAPDAGTIVTCGLPLDDANADGWRARLGWMPQHPHFLAEPLSTIIAPGQPLEPALIEAAALSGVLARLPEGAATQLGESGAGLSGGEARRVMLARLLHQRPEVVLADEPTADLDAETAERVTEALLSLARAGATLIVASHDPRLIARMERRLEVGA